MIPEQLKQQIDQWLDGDATREDEQRLHQILESFPDALDFLSDRALLHQMLARSVAFDRDHETTALESFSHEDFASGAGRQPTRAFAQPWLWASSAAVACLLFVSVLLLPGAFAGPVELVQQTLAGFQPALDRCYAVEVEAEGSLRRSAFSRRAVRAGSTLWIRGDGFVQTFESDGERLVWGRDLRGSVWFTLAGRSGAIFEADEVPESLQQVCELRSLQVPSLLESLLRDYDLEYSYRDDETSTVLARPRSGASNSKHGAVELEIASDSLLVRRVSVERIQDGRLVAVVSFSLVESQPRADSLYEQQSYLESGAEVLNRGAKRGERAELLRMFLQQLRSPPSTR